MVKSNMGNTINSILNSARGVVTSMDTASADPVWWLLCGMFCMVFLLIMLWLRTGLYRMARIYNWNGKRYCYLGMTPIKREGGGFAIYLGENIVDLAYTTAYCICPTKAFCKKNRYREFYVYAEKDRNYLVIDKGPIKTEIPL